MSYAELVTGPTAIRAYLRFDGVQLNALTPEYLLIHNGLVTVDDMAEAYRRRINAGVHAHFRFVD